MIVLNLSKDTIQFKMAATFFRGSRYRQVDGWPTCYAVGNAVNNQVLNDSLLRSGLGHFAVNDIITLMPYSITYANNSFANAMCVTNSRKVCSGAFCNFKCIWKWSLCMDTFDRIEQHLSSTVHASYEPVTTNDTVINYSVMAVIL